MAETFVDRARVTMARIKDDSSPLDSKVSAAIATKYADAFIIVKRPDLLVDADGDPIDISTIANETKGQVYINELRKFHKEILLSSRVPQAVDTAKGDEEDLIDTEFPSDLGAPE